MGLPGRASEVGIDYHERMRTRLGASIGTLLATCILQAGCHAPLNDRNGLYGAGEGLSALEPAGTTAFEGTDPTGQVVPLDRRGWTVTTVWIDQAQVEHLPSYGSAQPVVGSLGTSSLAWPTTDSALETDVDNDAEALNATLAPLFAAGNLVAFPVRAVMTPPWTVVREDPQATDFQLLPPDRTSLPWDWVAPSPIEPPEEDPHD